MKKVLSLFLAFALCFGMCATLTACSAKGDSSKYIGIWKFEDRNEYMYIYPDGTGDLYKGYHYNSFTWEVDGDYLVRRTTGAFGGESIIKYTFDNACLLDSQKIIVFRKYSNDTTVDV